MATPRTTIKHRRGGSAEWTTKNPILADGEIGIESNTRKFKIGDGFTFWRDLPYYINQDAVMVIVSEALATAEPIGPEEITAIAQQVKSELTLPNLVLLYENAKA